MKVYIENRTDVFKKNNKKIIRPQHFNVIKGKPCRYCK